MAQRKPLPCLTVALPIKLAKGKQGKGGNRAQPNLLQVRAYRAPTDRRARQ